MAVHNGCNGSGRQVIEVTLGADRAWWSDWSSKPAGVLLDLGRFDSYTLPPRSVLFVSHLRDMAAGNLPQSLSPSPRHLLRPVALPLRQNRPARGEWAVPPAALSPEER